MSRVNWQHVLAIYDERLASHDSAVYPGIRDNPVTWDVLREVLGQHNDMESEALEAAWPTGNIDISFRRQAEALQFAAYDIIRTREAHLDENHNAIGLPVYRGLGFKCPTVAVPPKYDLQRVHWNNIGSCWAYKLHGAGFYQSPVNTPHEVSLFASRHDCYLSILAGDAKVGDVDWEKTLYNNMEYPDEFEIRLLPGAQVRVYAIGTSYELEHPMHEQVTWEELNPPRWGNVHMSCGHDVWRPR